MRVMTESVRERAAASGDRRRGRSRGKVVLDGDEVSVEGAELIEGVGHGHAAGAGPAW